MDINSIDYIIQQNQKTPLPQMHDQQMNLKTEENILCEYQYQNSILNSKELKDIDEKIQKLKHELICHKKLHEEESNILGNIIAEMEERNSILIKNAEYLKNIIESYKEARKVSSHLFNSSVRFLDNTEVNEEKTKLKEAQEKFKQTVGVVKEGSEDNLSNICISNKEKNDYDSSNDIKAKFVIEKRQQVEGTEIDMNAEQYKLDRKKELTKLRNRRYRERLRNAKKEGINQLAIERIMRLSRERSKRYSNKKKMKHAEMTEIDQLALARLKELSKKRSKRYRDKKRAERLNRMNYESVREQSTINSHSNFIYTPNT